MSALVMGYEKAVSSELAINFLGGADEVGASCVLVEAAGHRILVDCGLRMARRNEGDRLPDLAGVGNPEDLDAVILSHAHMDHTGAAPLLMAGGRAVPVFATEATRDITEVLLRDAIKIMQLHGEAEDELPLYPVETVDALLGAIETRPYLEPFQVGGGAVTVTLFPAGHVLGAAMVGLDTPAGRVLVTGDFSVTVQKTVPGCILPRFRPDAVVCESTYGGRLHGNRTVEERRLVEAVAETIENGGTVLVPAFALGRAQEVLVLLERAMRQGRLRETPLFVDGMVRPICDRYARHPLLLQPPLRKRVLKRQLDPFFGEGRMARRVQRFEERAEILDGPPCVIVASSGMLSGGASVYYARRLVRDAKNTIILTGYQDEESPGRRLLDLASGNADSLVIDGEELAVNARVVMCGLSAHADEGEIVAMLSKLRPKDCFFVHGSHDARRRMARAAASCVRNEIHLPVAGDRVVVRYRGGAGKRRSTRAGISNGAPLDDEGLERLWLHLVQREGEGRSHTMGALLDAWYGDQGWTEAERADLCNRLMAGKAGYEADEKRPFLFRLVDVERPTTGSFGTMDQARSMQLARELFGDDPEFLRCGIDDATGELLLSFAFPLVLGSRLELALEELARRTGREISLNRETNIQALHDRLCALLPAGAALAKNPSIHHERRLVKVPVISDGCIERHSRDAICARFRQETGYELSLELVSAKATENTAPVRLDPRGVLEVNAAQNHIRQAFTTAPHRLRKVSKRGSGDDAFLELAFITPEIGEQYRDLLDELEQETRWSLRIARSVDQQSLLAEARALVATLGTITKGPSFHGARKCVSLRLAGLPTADDLDEVQRLFRERTAYELEITLVQ